MTQPRRITAGMIRLAKEWSKMFTRDKRANGDTFVKANDDARQELMDAIYTAHKEMLPDDYKYAMIESAIDAIADASEDDELSEKAREFADGEPDAYNSERYAWLASHSHRAMYVDEAVDEYGHSEHGIAGDLGAGWFKEAEEVFYSIAESLNDVADDDCQNCPHKRSEHDDTIGTGCLKDGCDCVGFDAEGAG